MPFTGVPGSANAMPGNTVPGLGGATNALLESASNTLALSQSVQVNITYNRGVNQSLTFAQRSGQAYDKTASNTLVLDHDAFDELISNTQLSHTLTLVQSATYTRSFALPVSQFIHLSHDPSANQQINREVSQSLTFTQVSVKTIPEVVSQSLTLVHTVDVVKWKRAGVVQALVLTHTNAVAITYSRSVFQGLALVQTLTKTISRPLTATNALVLSQVAVGVSSKRASSDLVLTHTAEFELVHGGRNTLELTQTVQENHTTQKRLFDVLPVFHTVARQLTARRSLSQTLTLTHAASAYVTRSVTSLLHLTHEAICDKVKPAFNQLVLTQTATQKASLGKVPTNLLHLTQHVSLLKATAKSAGNVLSLSQAVRATKIISVSVSQTLPLSQDLVRERFTESVDQSLALSQTVSGLKRSTRSVSQSLVITQAVTVSKTLNRHVTHNLVFQNSFTRYVGLPNQPVVSVPTVQAVLVRSLIVLESGPYVITLPTPEWNDKEAGNGKISIKRAMDGTRRVYKRDHPTSNLTYDLVMDRLKAIELRTFIMNCNSSVIRMTNWKGEIWTVVLVNNPFTFTEDAFWDSAWGNKSSVTLEFRGVKLN